MNDPLRIIFFLAAILVLTSCQTAYNPMDDFEQLEPVTILEPPDPIYPSDYAREEIDRGKYLVGLLGCGSCHTDGALVGSPNADRLLAGSGTGIAYTNPFEKNPAVIYPANLTPDSETGLGNRELNHLVYMIKVGTANHGTRSIPMMPRAAYLNITQDDALSIAVYLKSLAPVRHKVPANVVRGQPTEAPYVLFGVYQRR
jgi:hypothetical protein